MDRWRIAEILMSVIGYGVIVPLCIVLFLVMVIIFLSWVFGIVPVFRLP